MNMYLLAINWGAALDVVIFGIVMAFVILMLLVFIINGLGKVLAPKIAVFRNTPAGDKEGFDTDIVQEYVSADENAAIAMALHLYYSEEHDEESDVITIKTVERRYSPWNSKIYGLNNVKN